LQHPGPWPITAEEFYRDGHMFHGPRFQTVSGMDVLADNGLTGRLRIPPKHDLFASHPEAELLIDPAVIDGAGQLLGGWSQSQGGYVLPVGIDKVEFYRPTPPPGTEVPVRIEITRFDLEANTLIGDMEVQDGEGRVWMRIRGWRDRVFIKDSRFMEVQRAPERRCFSNRKTLPGLPLDAVCTEITDDHLSAGAFSWIAGLHLTVDEMDRLKGVIGRRRSQFLLGRVAVKDAVRQWLAEQGRAAEMSHPAAISIGRREGGQPFVEPIRGAGRLPEISISHTDGRTLAIAASVPVGIDVEPLSRKTGEILDDFATPDEARTIRSLADQEPSEAWPTRLWCAKESVSKALGTGLGGQLRDFELVDVQPDGHMWIQHRPSGRQMIATTLRDEDMILAYTVGIQEDPEPAPSPKTAPGATRTG
jgi:phosphopantetheinyl transferase